MQVVDGAGGAAPQLDENQLQPMDTSQDESTTTGATKRRAASQLTPSSLEGYTGGLRSFDWDQAADLRVLMMAFEAATYDAFVDTIDDDNRRYDYSSGKLLDRDKYTAGRKKELGCGRYQGRDGEILVARDLLSSAFLGILLEGRH